MKKNAMMCRAGTASDFAEGGAGIDWLIVVLADMRLVS